MKRTLLVAAMLAALVMPGGAQQTFSPDAEGFIRNWLVLAPIGMYNESGTDEIKVDLLGGEAAVRPRPDGESRIGDVPMTWVAHQTSDYFIDFRESFDKENGEHVTGYAVAYVHADKPMNVTLATGTNDQGKVWLNGREVVVFDQTRVLGKDADRNEVALVQGQNVLMIKVVNEVNSWQACARFLENGKPVTNLKISLTPQGN